MLGLELKVYSFGDIRYFHVHKGKDFLGIASSYVLSEERLESELKRLNPKSIFRPLIENEKNYSVFCAEK